MRLRHRTARPSRQVGVGLIEVLVALLLVSIGLLGAAGMQVRAIDYTTDTERRQMAAMVASEMLETLRGDAATALSADGTPRADLGGYVKKAGDALATVADSENCLADPAPAQRLACWGERAKQVMPELKDELITSNFAVGPAGASGLVSITVAWPVRKGQCLDLDGKDNDYCTYTLQSRL